MAAFEWDTQVRFRDCDPAGIVFYPRYFEMINDLVETFFERAIGWSFAKMHGQDGVGVPLGQVTSRFTAPSRLGDALRWSLEVTRVGGASVDLKVAAKGDDGPRLTSELTLVLVDLSRVTARRWPEPIRKKLGHFTKDQVA